MELSLIIPAYNEAQRIESTLVQYGECFAACFESFEILVIANGCRDNTAQIARDLSRQIPQIRVIEIPGKIGKGGAIRHGFELASGARVLFADADGATHPESLIALGDQLTSSDIAIGSRRLEGSQILHRQPLKRRILSRIFSVSIHLLFDLPYRDTQCGAKAFRHDVAHHLSTRVQENRWAFDVDLLLNARVMNYRVIEYPVVWTDQAGSHLRVVSTAREVLRSLWRMKRRHLSAKIRFGPEAESAS